MCRIPYSGSEGEKEWFIVSVHCAIGNIMRFCLFCASAFFGGGRGDVI